MAIGIALTVLPDTQEEALKMVEILSRTAIGIAFDGVSATISFTIYDPEVEEP